MQPIARKYSDGDLVPHDTNTNEYDALFIGGTGDVTIVDSSGNTATFKNVADGTMLPVSTKIVKSTGTDATNIIGLHFRL